ncbi:MAG: glycosyltransferase family 2 protein [Candidatus Saccharibacteria bacterium]
MQNKPHISVIIPLYNCADCIDELYRRLAASLETITPNFELVMVNDCSPQNDWEMVNRLTAKDSRVVGLNLSRNFGQHQAITAGLEAVRGDWVVVMDGDLQDQPEEICKLYKKAQEGFDVVFARRQVRHDNIMKKITSYLFARVFDYFADTRSDSSIANFSIVSYQVAKNVVRLKEHNRSYPHFIRWVGYNQSFVDVDHAERYKGESAYNFSRRFDLAMDIIVAFSNKPLKFSIKLGFLIAFLSLLYGLYILSRYFFIGSPVEGWTTIIVSLYFIGGMLFANLGLLGLYLGKVFDEAKNRPLYIVKESVNLIDQE